VDADAGAAVFHRAITQLQRAAATQHEARPELLLEEETPPRRLAPFAFALAAVVTGPADGPAGGGSAEIATSDAGAAGDDSDAEVGGGRFVLLFDPAGQPGWDGRYRVISYVRAELEPEMAADPLINAVGWSWLTEALEDREAGYRNISGTVTTVVTQGFGSKQDEPMGTEFELRASWSPTAQGGAEPELTGHLAAWCDVICAAAGLPPLAPGVAALRPSHRRRRP
jgi:hypothetical protein